MRNIWTEDGDQAKDEIQVRFPLKELDMAPYFFGKLEMIQHPEQCGILSRQRPTVIREEYILFPLGHPIHNTCEGISHLPEFLPQEYRNVLVDNDVRDIVENKIVIANFRHLTELETIEYL